MSIRAIVIKALIVVSCAILPCTVMATPTLTFSNAPGSTVDVGDTFDIDVLLSGMGPGSTLDGFTFDIAFDESVLTLTDVFASDVYYDELNHPWLSEFSDMVEDSESFIAMFMPMGLYMNGEPFTLFTLSFTADAEGYSDLLFTGSTDYLGFENTLALYGNGNYGVPFDVELGTSSVTVAGSEVPEPATMLLFGAGMAGIGCIRRKRKV